MPLYCQLLPPNSSVCRCGAVCRGKLPGLLLGTVKILNLQATSAAKRQSDFTCERLDTLSEKKNTIGLSFAIKYSSVFCVIKLYKVINTLIYSERIKVF